MRLIRSCLWLISIVAHAQTITHTNVVISKEGTNIFPLFSSSAKPRVAAAINRALQIASFNHTNIEKNPDAYLDEERYSLWNYSVDYANDRLLHVTTSQYFPKQSMHTPEWTKVLHYWFDTSTGDKVMTWQFITDEGLPRMKLLAADRMGEAIKKSYADIVKKYPQKEFADRLPNLEESLNAMKKNFSDPLWDRYEFNPAGKSYTFFEGWKVKEENDDDDNVDALGAELNNGIQVILSTADIKPFASAFWTYYILHSTTTPPAHDPISHTWCGMIGGKIPVTFVIVNHPVSTTITGLEVYDNHGGTISLKGGVKGTSYWFDEIDDKGTKTGSFEFTSANGQLTGTWKNGPGTKTMDFKATVGGADLP